MNTARTATAIPRCCIVCAAVSALACPTAASILICTLEIRWCCPPVRATARWWDRRALPALKRRATSASAEACLRVGLWRGVQAKAVAFRVSKEGKPAVLRNLGLGQQHLATMFYDLGKRSVDVISIDIHNYLAGLVV